ncbi:gliding motility-associated C-terminal domain-containing protein [Flavobacterium sp. LS1R49]|uniref:Gliding motility-associated C-terminal domain-containing protein n=1 Tax=Flavobacterium shii TaxID=2987687 RepID=A0A9X3C6U2_9FLAO|nr:gliding motility-associated C-terminal domain-containing protein [Flavobacterium shii]MCV9930207.1 gliding motility-associated C-terminal domain-containing protein [Flavobacterium shii]
MVSPSNITKVLTRLFPLFLLLLLGIQTSAQSGSFGNTYVANSGVMAIYGQHNFQPGYIVTARTSPQGYVTFIPGSSWVGAANTAHVNGYVSKLGNTAFTYPVGDGVNLRTLAVSAPTAITTQLGVAWFTGDPSTVQDPTDGTTHPTTTFTGALTGVSTVGFWDWVPFTGSTVNGLTVTVSIPDVSAFSTAANLRLVGWNGSAWIDLSGSSNASGNTAGSTLTGTIPSPSTITAIAIGTNNPITDLAITKTANNMTPTVGSNVVFTVVVTNNGPNNATGVQVTDMLTAGYTYVSSNAPAGTNYTSATGLWTIGALANAASVTLTVTATVDATGPYNNTATVSGNENDPNTANNTATATPIPVASADLSVTKTVNNANPTVGTNVIFTLTATNGGPSAGTGVNVTDQLPTGYTYVSATPAPGTTYTPGTGIWSIGNLANAATSTLTITATVNPTGNYANTATIAGNESDPTPGNNSSTATTTPVPITDLAITKSVNNATPAVGSNVTFTLTATNNGPSPGTGIRVFDQLPTGYTYVSSVPSGTTTYNAGLGSWTIGNLASGANATLTVTATVNATGTYLNTATISGTENDPVAGNNTASVTTTPTPTTDRSIVKTVNNATPAVGSNVVFTLVATNNGPSAGTGISVTDLLPSGYTYVSSIAPSGTNYNQATGLWTIGALANGASSSLNITATVNATGVYANTATITGTENDPTPGNNSSTSTPVPVATSNLNVVKTVNNPTPYAGNNVVFTITAANAGPSDATGVQVNDLLPSGYTYVTATPSIGTYNSGTGLWTIGNLANGANATLDITATVNTSGNYSNTATISGQQNDPNPSDNSSTVTPTPINVQLAKTGPAATNAGNTVNYTVTVTNNGTGNALAQSIIDNVPAALTNVSWTAIAQGAAVVSAGAGGTGNSVAVTGDIPAGAANSITINITGTLPASSTVTTLANTASINTPGSPVINSNTVNTTVTQVANIQIQKTGPPTLFAGNSYSYSLSVSNSGPSNANNVNIIDNLPTGFTVTNWTTTTQNGAVINGPTTGTGNLNLLANIPAGTATVQVTINGTLDGNYAPTTIVNTATATPPGGTTATSSVTSTVSRQANIRVTKSGPANIGAGDAISYTIRIVNDGPSDSPGLIITDVIPDEVLSPTWTATTSGGATISSPSGAGNINITGDIPSEVGVVTIVVNGTVDPATTDPDFSNTATATFPIGSPVTDPDPASASSTINTVVNSTQDVRVSKNGPAIVNINDPITYTIVVTNAGNPDVDDAVLVDNVPTSVTVTGWTITPNNGASIGGSTTAQSGTTPNINVPGIFIPGQSSVPNANLTLVIQGTVNASTPTTFTNTVTVTTPNGAPASSVTTSVNQSTDLFVQKSGPTSAIAGGPITYSIKIGNNGPLDVTGLTIQDLIPADVQNVSWNASISGSASFSGSGNGTTNAINLTGNIAAGAANYITINVTGTVNPSPSATTMSNNATVTSSAAIDDYNLSNNSSSVTTTITTESDLAIVKTVDNLAPAVGNTVVFTLSASNNGPSNGTGITVTDLLPAGYTFQSSSAGTDYVPATGIWTIGSILANGTASMTITAVVNAAGPYANTATINGTQNDPSPNNDSSTVTPVPTPVTDLAVNKTVDNATPAVGTNVVFTLTINNNGPSNATGVMINDLLPSGYTFASATANTGTYNAGTGIWTVGNLSNNFIGTLSITAAVNATGVYANTATISGNESDPNSANNTSTATPVPVASTDRSVVKTVNNPNPAVGSNVVFTLVATNNGPSDGTGITVTDLLPAGYTYISSTEPGATTYDPATGIWNIGTLANGASSTMTITALVNATGPYGNTATIDGTENDPTPGNNSSSSTPTPTPTTDLAVVKTVDNANPPVGSTVVFTVVATNNGPSDATGVIVNDAVPTGYTTTGINVTTGTVDLINSIWTIGALANGASATLTITATVLATGNYANTATISGNENDTTPANNSSTSTPTPVPTSDRSLVKTVDNANPAVGSNVVFSLAATNNGPSDSTGVTVTDQLPAGYTYVSSNAPLGTNYDPSSGLWTIGTLTNGTTSTLTITATVNATGPYANTATITGTENDPTPGNNSSTSTPTAVPTTDRSVVKTVNNTTPAVGSNVVFTLVATNNGPSDGTGITVTDFLPTGYNYVSSTEPTGTTYDSGSGLWNIGALANGASSTMTITATVNASGVYTNTATIAGTENDPNATNNSSNVTPTPVASTDRSVVKTVDNPAPAVGSNAVFTLVATNNGPSDGTGITVTDLLPAGYTYVSSTPPGTTTYDPATGIWNIGALANGASSTITITATVNATGPYANTATIDGTENDPTPGNNSSTSTPTPSPRAHLTTVKVIKDPTQTTFVPGESVVYRVTVTNNGPSDAMGVNVQDTPPNNTTITGWTAVPSTGVTYPNASGTGDLNETIADLPNGAVAIYDITIQTPANYTINLVNVATASSSTVDPNPGPCTTCSSDPITPTPMAHLTTVKTLNDPTQTTFVPGQDVIYLINVTNNGPSDASAVNVTDNAPTGTTISSWTTVPATGVTYPNTSGTGNLNETIATLPSGLTATYQVTVQTPSNFTGTLVNSVAASSTTPDPNPGPCTDCTTDPITPTPMAHLTTVKTRKDPTQTSFIPGEAVIYQISVTNNGPSDASTVNIVDNAPAGTTISSWTAVPSVGVTYPNASGTGNLNETITTLTSGLTATYEVTVQTPSNFTGTLSNSVTATSTTPDPNPGPCTDCTTDPLPPTPMAHLTTVKTLNDPTQTSFVPGQAVVYLINVTNNGPSDASAVNIADNAPTGTTISSWTAVPATGVTYPNASGTGNLNETIATLPNGLTATYQVTVQTPSNFTGTLVNSVTATSTTPDPNPGPCTDCTTDPIPPTPMAHLTTVKTLNDPTQTSFVPGQAVVYLINVTNNGPSDASAVNIADNAPTGTTISSWTAVPATGVTYPNASGTGNLNETIATLTSGLTATYQVTVQTPSNFTGTLSNSVTATSTTPDPNPGPCTDCTTDPIPPTPMAHLTTVKTLNDPTQTSFVPGQAVVYLINVTNNGPSDASAVNIVDNAPTGTTISSWTAIPATGVTYPNASGTGNLNETIATLPNGLTATYQVTVQTPSNFTGTLVNSVTATSTTPDPNPGPCTDCTTDPIPPAPMAHLTTVKTLNDPTQTSFVPGQAVVYLINVTNNGPSDAAAVNIADNAPTGTTISSWTAVPTTGVTYPNASGTGNLNETIATLPNGLTATYQVTVQTPSNFTGTLVNSVTATSTTPDPNPGPCTDCTTDPIPPTPMAHLTTVKTLNDPTQTSFVPGQAVIYLINVTNNGPSDAAAVNIADNAPTGTTISSWTAVPATGVIYPNASGTGNLNETIATLPNGLTATYQVTVQTPSNFTGTLVNSVTATSTTPDPNPGPCTNCTTDPIPPTPMAHLNTVKTLKNVAQTSFVAGQGVVFRITVTNNGPSDAAAVNIIDNAPTGTTISNWTAVPATGVTYPNASGTGNINETLLTLGNGLTAIYDVTVLTPVDFTGPLVNTVSATSTTPDPTPGPCTTCSTNPINPSPKVVPEAHLNTVKTLKDPTQTTFVPGEAVVYRITVTNQGPAAADSVNIVDNAPTGTTISSWTAITSTGVTYPNASGTGNLNETLLVLGNGLTAIYEVTVQTPAIFTGATLVNSVTATSTTPDPTPGPCTTCSSNPIPPALPKIVIPNVITPGGDGYNDKFVIKGLEYYPGSPLIIYNRWGNQVYRSDSYDNSWNANGLSGGTYYYIFKLKTTDGNKDYNGWIEVLK